MKLATACREDKNFDIIDVSKVQRPVLNLDVSTLQSLLLLDVSTS